MIHSNSLLEKIDQKRLPGELQGAIPNNQVRYQDSLTSPGHLETVNFDGTKEIDLFKIGGFTPVL